MRSGMPCYREKGPAETAEPESKISSESGLISRRNTRCLRFAFHRRYPVDRVGQGVLARYARWHWPAVGTRARSRTLPTPLTPSSTGPSPDSSSGHHRGSRPTPWSP